MPKKHKARMIYEDTDKSADLRYLTGFAVSDPFLYFEAGGNKAVVLSSLEYGRALKECRKDIEVISITDLEKRFNCPKAERWTAMQQIKAVANFYKVKNWDVPYSFPFGLAEQLQKENINVKAVNDFCPERAVKSAEEITAVKNAVALAVKGLNRAIKVLQEAKIAADQTLHWQDQQLTAELLRGEIDAEIARNGGVASGTIVAPGKQAADPHQRGYGPISANEAIVIDIFPRCLKTGYYGDLTRTLVKGKAPEIVWKAFNSVKEAKDLALKKISPEFTGAEIHQLVEAYLENAGFETKYGAGIIPYGFFHSTGHGLGLEVHEEPSLSIREKNKLKAGNIVTVEPGLYYPEWGGVRLEDVALVTENGCENLTEAECFLEINE